MNPNRLAPLVLIAAAFATGCTQPLEDDDVATGQDDLGVKTASSFTLREWKGYDCSANASLTVDLVGGRLSGDYCENGSKVLVTRWLRASELSSLKSTLAKVKTTPQSSVCSSTGMTRTLSVLRGSKESKYVDVVNACGVKGTSVTEATLVALATLTRATAKKGPRRPVPGGTTNGLPSGVVGGTCVDQTAKPAYASFGGITFTYAEVSPTSSIRWDGSAVNGGRAGDVFTEYLRSVPAIGLDGSTSAATVGTQWSPVGKEDVFVTGKLEDDKIWVTMGTKSGRFSCSFEVQVE